METVETGPHAENEGKSGVNETVAGEILENYENINEKTSFNLISAKLKLCEMFNE